jgi:hypothetical protein
MNWFGEPWPSAELRAPVCEDDALRIPPPKEGELCTLCDGPFRAGDRGFMMPHITADKTSPWISWTELRYCHLDCLTSNVLP